MNHSEENARNNLFLLGMVLSMTCWGFSWTSGKVLSAYASPLSISFLRFALTFVSLAAILVFMREKLTILRSGWKDLLAASLLICLYTFLFFKGLVEGRAGFGGVLVTVLNPVIAYAIMLMKHRRVPRTNEMIGLGLALVAGAVLLRVFVDASNLFDKGNIYFVLAAITWAVLSGFTARAKYYGSSVTFSFWMYGISTVVMVLLADLPESLETVQNADVRFWGNMIFSSTITTSLATTFYFAATSKVGASKASSFIFMVPLSAAFGSWLFLDEKIELHTITGGLLGIAAVYILNRK